MTENKSFELKFKYRDSRGKIVSKTLDVGSVESIVNTYSPTVTSAQIPVLPAEDKFIMDLGVVRRITVTFTRVSPHNADKSRDTLENDSRDWSNGFWAWVVNRYIVNRWQQETDGVKVLYTSYDTETYPHIGELNAYVEEFGPKQTIGTVNMLSGTLKVVIGSMDVTKVATRYTIIYNTNYQGNLDDYIGPESNTVRVWDLDEDDPPRAIQVPGEWIDGQIQQGITVGIVRWTDGLKYYAPNDPIENTGVTTLRAVYDTRERIE